MKDLMLRTLLDPVLIYAAVVMMSIMYHYRSSLAIVYGITAYVIGWIVFRVFDFINKHKLIGSAAYIALFVLFIFGVQFSVTEGSADYPISWGIWFLTPQDVLEYNKWYTLAIYLLFLIFMLSVIYYFTRVRYRIFMNFLIFIIPFAIYGKEYEKMPTIFIILLSVGYVLLMVYFRQLHGDEKTVVVARDEVWKPVAVYAVIFAAAAALVPKPAIEADRTVLETLISADQFTDRLVAMLNVFRDTTSSQQFTGNLDNTPLYYARASEPLRLKTSTFSTYDFNTDSWSILEMDDDAPMNSLDTTFEDRFDETPYQIASAGDLAQAFLEAADLDSDFAEKYGLSAFAGTELTIPAQKELSIYSAYYDETQFAPVPQYAQEMTDTSYDKEMALIYSGLVYAADSRFSSNERFTFNYSSENFFYNDANRAVIDALDRSDYGQMLEDADDILWNAYTEEYNDDMVHYWYVIRDESNIYGYYEQYLLDYGENQRIYDLAHELTDSAASDFEKAKILEGYFYKNGYIYDTSYLKTSKENAESFLFETKTGVCYEYATAMVLMARAVGIPARYCEGYNMSEELENDQYGMNYVVTSRSAHGFPELYIKGYGWVSFEPTVTDVLAQPADSSATDKLTRAGIIILAAALLVILSGLLYPAVSHKVFLFTARKRHPDQAIVMIIRRLCRLCGISSVNTSQEAARKIMQMTGKDISSSASLFDKSVYGGIALNEAEKEMAFNDYIEVYNALKELRKNRRRKLRNS